LLLILMLIHAFYLAHKIDLQVEKTNQVISQAEKGVLESKPYVFVRPSEWIVAHVYICKKIHRHSTEGG
ncbi:hypothetical protein B2J68_20000, partial [Vibrio cholerae]|uniref:hypothetical protein n=1 Tax=Vibrio cholerae TaxID=666 RepID=UPI000B6F89AA